MKTKFYLLVLCCSMIATATVWSQDPFVLSADGDTLKRWTGEDPIADMTAYPTLENVTKIASGAFNGISTLKKVIISKNVTTFEGYYFTGTPLDSVGVASGNGYFSDIDGVLFNWGKTYLFYYPRGKTATSYTIPEGVEKIGNIAFYQHQYLKKITFPTTGFNEIMIDQAFWGIANLDTIKNFELTQITSIPENTFGGCWHLKSIALPNTLTEIKANAFNDCQYLPSITIPASVTSIGDKAFYGIWALLTVESHNTVAPTLENDSVFALKGNIPARNLYVPKGYVNTYQTNWVNTGKFNVNGAIQEIILTSIGELNNQSDMAIWVKDNKFQVKDNEYGSELSFNIFNSTGQLVQSLSNLSETIDQNLKGLYIVNVKRAGEAIKSFKIML